MNLTEFLEYMIDNSDGPVTFSVAGAKVSVSLTGDRENIVVPKVFNRPPPNEIFKTPKPRKDYSMREVTERTVRADNNLGPDWVAGHTLMSGRGSAAEYLKRTKIPYTIFYTSAGRGTKMAFVQRKDLNG
jgi:hypothetical protein